MVLRYANFIRLTLESSFKSNKNLKLGYETLISFGRAFISSESVFLKIFDGEKKAPIIISIKKILEYLIL